MAELYGFASNLQEARMLMASGVTMIQYRNKDQGLDEVVSSVKTIMAATAEYPRVRIIVNDSLEAALASEAHGVHLGQDDGDYRSICQKYGDRILIAVSVDTVEEAMEAEKAGVHSIGAGAVYGSVTKPEAPFMGIPLLRDICSSVSVPVSAIGGITLEKLEDVVEAGAGYVCVISDIHSREDPQSRVRQYLEKLEHRV